MRIHERLSVILIRNLLLFTFIRLKLCIRCIFCTLDVLCSYLFSSYETKILHEAGFNVISKGIFVSLRAFFVALCFGRTLVVRRLRHNSMSCASGMGFEGARC